MKSFKQGAALAMRKVLGGAALAALAGLAACGGGGTSQINPFKPTRIVTFGDETSYIDPQGRKYSINGVDPATGLQNCALNPIWVQSLAASFGLVYPQCDPNHLAAPQGVMQAVPGSKVADVASAVDKFFGNSFFTNKDLVTILAGANDIQELYLQFPAQSQDALIAEAKRRGTALADVVNRIATANGRVVVSTLPDMGTTPYASAEKLAHGDIDRSALLSSLSDAFNTAMRVELINDGRLIGLVLLDETVQGIHKFPGAFGFTDVNDPACLPNVVILSCTTATLFPGATGDSYLWATNLLLSSGGQARLASLAVTRAHNNPF
ncbi:MAG: esterase [Paucibacter sp.]|nr:esterase [Roseateles sp.]